MRRCFRLVLAAALLLLCAIACASDCIIFIPPSAAGPAVDPVALKHPLWVLWPASVDADASNRALSIVTGEDWIGESADTVFFAPTNGRFMATNLISLKRRGFFEAERRLLATHQIVAALGREGDLADPLPILALHEDGEVSTTRWDHFDVGIGRVLVAKAHSWDDVAEIERQTRLALVVEYPLPRGQRWGRAWQAGGAWPKGLPEEVGVPGLIRAADLATTLWGAARRVETPPNAPTANRWLEFASGEGRAMVFALSLAWVLVCILAQFAIAFERGEQFVRVGLYGSLLLPSTLAMACGFTARWGLGNFSQSVGWHFVLLACLSTILAWVGVRTRLWAPAVAFAVVGLFPLLAFDPTLSPFGGACRLWPELGPGAPLGAIALGVAVLHAWPSGKVGLALGWIAAVLLAVAPLVLAVWWKQYAAEATVLAMIPILARLPRIARWAPISGGAVGGFHGLVALTHGIVWSPWGLLAQDSDRAKWNAFELFAMLLSPGFAALLVFVGLGWAVSSRFELYALRRTWRGEPFLRRMGVSVAALGVMSSFEPWLIGGFVTAGAGLVTLVLLRALLIPEPQ